jgi:hypothetical protein
LYGKRLKGAETPHVYNPPYWRQYCRSYDKLRIERWEVELEDDEEAFSVVVWRRFHRLS